MDGIPSLPALPSQAPAPFSAPLPGGGAPLPQRAPQPVGRPSNDPAAQEQRAVRSAEHQRLTSLTPQRARDSKLYVYKMVNGRPSRQPIAKLLASALEAHAQSSPSVSDDDKMDEAVIHLLPPEITDCTVRCQWFSKDNRPIADIQPWDLDIGDVVPDEPETLGPEDLADDLLPPEPPTQQTFPTQQVMPPPPPTMDIATIARSFREERSDERRNGEGVMQAIMAMQQNSANLQLQMQQQARQDAMAAEERADKRRAEFRHTIVTVVLPLVLPMIQNMFGPKGMSPETIALIEVLKGNAANKGTDAMMLENMFKLQGKMSEQAMELQTKAAGSAAAMQAQVSDLMFKNLLGTLKETMDLKTKQPEEREPSTLETIAQFAGPLIASLTGNQTAPGGQPAMEGNPPAAPAQVAPTRRIVKPPPPPPAPPVAADGQQVPPPPKRAAPPPPESFPDKHRIVMALRGVRRMSLGEWNPENHWRAVGTVARWMPDSVKAAVKAQDRQQVMTLATEAALSDAQTVQWVTDAENLKFLERTLVDVRLLLMVEGNLQNLTEEQQQAGIIAHRQAVEQRRQAVQLSNAAAATAQLRHENPPLPGETAAAEVKPVEATVVTDPASMVSNPTSAPVPVATVVEKPGA